MGAGIQWDKELVRQFLIATNIWFYCVFFFFVKFCNKYN
jgi:hypothetical protein